MASLKEQKEAFVTGHEGTSPLELLLICAFAPMGLAFFQAASRWLSTRTACARIPLAVLDFFSFWIPFTLCQTIWLYPWGVVYLAIEALTCALFIKKPKQQQQYQLHKQNVMTIYRSSIYCFTFIAILAVDFHLFPRRFAKTETRGTSWMDLGAASFVIVGGLLSPRARKKHSNNNNNNTAAVQSWKHCFVKVAPVVALGLVRLLTLKGIDYQEHASEYGIHWNFFFTLAVLAILPLLVPGPSWILPTILLASYQYALSQWDLQVWIEDAPRSCPQSTRVCVDLFVANREGILGCIGYGALYLLSEFIGTQYYWTDSIYSLLPILFILVVIWQGLLSLGVDVSRRSTNATFCIWALIVNLIQLAAIDFLLDSNLPIPPIMKAVNRQGLLSFVIANLLTGLVNLSINTLLMENLPAFGILLVYAAAVGIAAVSVERVTRMKNKSI